MSEHPALPGLVAGPSPGGCICDFCTGRKSWSENWCPRCAKVRMAAPKWWENLDVCDECEQVTALEALRLVQTTSDAYRDQHAAWQRWAARLAPAAIGDDAKRTAIEEQLAGAAASATPNHSPEPNR